MKVTVLNESRAAWVPILTDTIEVSWHIDDVMSVAPDLTANQARRVLWLAKKHHDANDGINWDVLETIAVEVRSRL